MNVDLMTELFKQGRPVVGAESNSSKYIKLASEFNLKNYRLISLQDAFEFGIDRLPKYVSRLISEEGELLMIGNPIGSRVIGLNFRSLTSKEFRAAGLKHALPYGIGLLQTNFTYGTLLIITEGMFDADVVRQFYPNVIACMTSGLSTFTRNLVSRLTSKVMLCYDNDEAGTTSYYRDSKFLKGKNTEVYKGKFNCKDPGEIMEFRYDGDPRYEIEARNFLNQINRIKETDFL